MGPILGVSACPVANGVKTDGMAQAPKDLTHLILSLHNTILISDRVVLAHVLEHQPMTRYKIRLVRTDRPVGLLRHDKHNTYFRRVLLRRLLRWARPHPDNVDGDRARNGLK